MLSGFFKSFYTQTFSVQSQISEHFTAERFFYEAKTLNVVNFLTIENLYLVKIKSKRQGSCPQIV